jgi:hypothetical protein
MAIEGRIADVDIGVILRGNVVVLLRLSVRLEGIDLLVAAQGKARALGLLGFM